MLARSTANDAAMHGVGISQPAQVMMGSTAMLTAVLDEIDYAVMVVDGPTRRLIHANRLALEECRAHGTLQLEGGRINARHRDCLRPLEKALALAGDDKRTLLNLAGEHDAIPVAVVPLRDGPTPQSALLLFGKRKVCETLSVGFYSRLHALTPSEVSVLGALCRGLKPADIAKEAGVQISTVRTQVSSIRLKTNSASIRELISRMATLPPINPALRMTLTH